VVDIVNLLQVLSRSFPPSSLFDAKLKFNRNSSHRMQVKEKRSLPPGVLANGREPPAPPTRKAPFNTVPNPSFRKSLDPEKARSAS
jgi:hypothetical protein